MTEKYFNDRPFYSHCKTLTLNFPPKILKTKRMLCFIQHFLNIQIIFPLLFCYNFFTLIFPFFFYIFFFANQFTHYMIIFSCKCIDIFYKFSNDFQFKHQSNILKIFRYPRGEFQKIATSIPGKRRRKLTDDLLELKAI